MWLELGWGWLPACRTSLSRDMLCWVREDNRFAEDDPKPVVAAGGERAVFSRERLFRNEKKVSFRDYSQF